MKITNDFNQQNKQLTFAAKTLPIRKLRMKATTNQFIKEVSGKPQSKNFSNLLDTIIGPIASFSNAPYFLAEGEAGTAIFNATIGVVLREFAVNFHKTAVKKAPELGKRLQNMNFSTEEKQKIVKSYLRQDGNIVFSNLFNVFCPKRVAKLAEGEPVKDVFLSLFSRTKGAEKVK